MSPATPLVKNLITTTNGNDFLSIPQLEEMDPFFISLTSDSDVWAFISSTGALSAGRVGPAEAFFPYDTVDKIHDNYGITGPVTMIRLENGTLWEPFTQQLDPNPTFQRSLQKSVIGNVVEFKETSKETGLSFSYRWQSSHRFGLVRQAVLQNQSASPITLSLLDGVRNLMAPGIGLLRQSRYSCLAEAYKKTELLESSRIGIFALSAGIMDLPIPLESLEANVVWITGLTDAAIVFPNNSPERFRRGRPLIQETPLKGQHGGYFLQTELCLQPGEKVAWNLVINGPISATKVSDLNARISTDSAAVQKDLEQDLKDGTAYLERLLSGCDSNQKTSDPIVDAHHCANVTYNMMRGGTPVKNYDLPAANFHHFVQTANQAAALRHQKFLSSLNGFLPRQELQGKISDLNDPVLSRLFGEYIPLTFSRRHGDPSRPWNNFAINVRHPDGQPYFAYQGNWRDIFQNWEALALSYPDFLENMIAKFVNASTMDGYNPYRITSDGLDWEEPNPEDPWAGIGYWADHQIVYLNKLLEWQESFFPGSLTSWLHTEEQVYADVPYEMASLEKILRNPRETITFNKEKSKTLRQERNSVGSDAYLRRDEHDEPIRVTFLEKLLVPVLIKLTNFVPGGGIWITSQRPEWNDANNALVGYGLSMVTACQLRRHLTFLEPILRAKNDTPIPVSIPVTQLFNTIKTALTAGLEHIDSITSIANERAALSLSLAQAGSTFRDLIYAQAAFEKEPLTGQSAADFFVLARQWLDTTIRANLREDGLYNSYNVLSYNEQHSYFDVKTLYPMLEGQVAVLSTGILSSTESAEVLTALKNSAMYRADIDSYTLYPDRDLPDFLEKGIIPENRAAQLPLLTAMLKCNDPRIVQRDQSGILRFHPELDTGSKVTKALAALRAEPKFSDLAAAEEASLLSLYEEIFNHTEFTGRSGMMFGYEGLGCTYWHMVSKLLLSVQEDCIRHQQDKQFKPLAELYYQIRQGLGFNKTPQEYGAFPTDPYSHTPAKGGAKQPGMTGQVKEEIITRFGELGVRVEQGTLHFSPRLLRKSEFLTQPDAFDFIDLHGEPTSLPLSENELAFTFCQTPIIYQLNSTRRAIEVTLQNVESIDGSTLPEEWSRAIFQRNGNVKTVRVFLMPDDLSA